MQTSAYQTSIHLSLVGADYYPFPVFESNAIFISRRCRRSSAMLTRRSDSPVKDKEMRLTTGGKFLSWDERWRSFLQIQCKFNGGIRPKHVALRLYPFCWGEAVSL